jgi:hypothetical protein
LAFPAHWQSAVSGMGEEVRVSICDEWCAGG